MLSMQLAELAARQAHEEATPQPDQPKAEPPRPGRADPYLIFIRLRRAIYETVVLINRLAAGILPKAPRPRREPAPLTTPEPAAAKLPETPEDPRRPYILRYFREGIDITQKRRKTPITHQDIENHVAAELAKDPDHRLQGRVILLKVCKSLDLPFYANRMQPELFRQPQALSICAP